MDERKENALNQLMSLLGLIFMYAHVTLDHASTLVM